MEIKQAPPVFTPVTIVLNTLVEAEAFFDIVDKVESYRCNANGHFSCTSAEIKLISALSNARTDGVVRIPR